MSVVTSDAENPLLKYRNAVDTVKVRYVVKLKRVQPIFPQPSKWSTFEQAEILAENTIDVTDEVSENVELAFRSDRDNLHDLAPIQFVAQTGDLLVIEAALLGNQDELVYRSETLVRRDTVSASSSGRSTILLEEKVGVANPDDPSRFSFLWGVYPWCAPLAHDARAYLYGHDVSLTTLNFHDASYWASGSWDVTLDSEEQPKGEFIMHTSFEFRDNAFTRNVSGAVDNEINVERQFPTDSALLDDDFQTAFLLRAQSAGKQADLQFVVDSEGDQLWSTQSRVVSDTNNKVSATFKQVPHCSWDF